MSAEKKLSNEDFIQNIILVLKKYLPGLPEEKFTQFMVECIAGKGEFENIRYVTLEDYNMCTDSEGFYTAHFHEDNDLLFIWEDDFYSCGYTPDELEEDGARNTYIGFIYLKDKKYIRVNGYGDEIEYGSDNPADEHPDWKEWC